MQITASNLYDYLRCQHRVWRDIYGPKEEKIQETNPFVELMWKRGIQHEKDVVSQLGDLSDLRGGSIEERFNKTIEAMKNGVPLIYQGVLQDDALFGTPDLLEKLSNRSYMPIDIKSGSGFEGGEQDFGEEGKPKKHYAVQLCLYNELLKKLGFATHNKGKIIDINKETVEYNLIAPMGVRNKTTWWEFYEQVKEGARALMENRGKNNPANSSICKLCPWYASCKKWCKDNDDLTNIFYLGRSARDTINFDLLVKDVKGLLEINLEEVLQKKRENPKYLRGIGEKSLVTAIKRAEILRNTREPVINAPITFPKVTHELFFDVENDPTQEFVYLHGIYERSAGKEEYINFTATEVSNQAEEEIWRKFWQYIASLPENDFAVYFYSQHEKTIYKRLHTRYPDVIELEKLEEFFAHKNVIDLYKAVLKSTDWPLSSYSLKELAAYLGFEWRDETPSGALSIQWFNEFISTKDQNLLDRILKYNEDDCRATMILKDALEKLSEEVSR